MTDLINYRLPESYTPLGLPRPEGGGYRRRPGVEPRFPADTFPLTSTTGLPWIKEGKLKDGVSVWNMLVGDESWKGFAFCYDEFGPYSRWDPQLRNTGPAYWAVDGERTWKPFNPRGHDQGTGIYFFDGDQYLVRFFNFNLA